MTNRVKKIVLKFSSLISLHIRDNLHSLNVMAQKRRENIFHSPDLQQPEMTENESDSGPRISSIIQNQTGQ